MDMAMVCSISLSTTITTTTTITIISIIPSQLIRRKERFGFWASFNSGRLHTDRFLWQSSVDQVHVSQMDSMMCRRIDATIFPLLLKLRSSQVADTLNQALLACLDYGLFLNLIVLGWTLEPSSLMPARKRR